MDKLLAAITQLDEEVRIKSAELLKMRNKWLILNRWEVYHEKIGFTETYFYHKYGKSFICEYEAIEIELHGTS